MGNYSSNTKIDPNSSIFDPELKVRHPPSSILTPQEKIAPHTKKLDLYWKRLAFLNIN